MLNVIKGKCPKCTKGDIFKSKGNIFRFKFPEMNETCPTCNHRFEKEPGYFVGAMYLSYGLGILEMLLLFLITYSFFSYIGIVILLISGLVLLSFFNFRYSRIFWIWIFRT